MDRLQKKCVLASAGLHALLAGVLVFGPAFLAPTRKGVDLDVLTVIPARLVDAPFSGGGTPNAKPPPPAPLFRPEPLPPAPAPKPETVTKPAPVPPKSQPLPKPADEPDITKPAPGKRLPNVSTDLVTRTPAPPAKASNAERDAAERAQVRALAEARRRALAGALSNISNVTSGSTSVEIPGPGGEAYANYQQVLKSIYTHAWIVPPDVGEGDATTKASVTIASDGTVKSARIIGPSGNVAADASVRRTLERVTVVPPFPAGAKDKERTFTISFNVNAKRQLG